MGPSAREGSSAQITELTVALNALQSCLQRRPVLACHAKAPQVPTLAFTASGGIKQLNEACGMASHGFGLMSAESMLCCTCAVCSPPQRPEYCSEHRMV